MKAIPRTTAVLAALALTGCAVGNQHRYTGASPALTAQGTHAVAVATQDHRPYVLSKNKQPNFVGLSRGGFGNPFDVTTESGKPLASDFSATIAGALRQRGFKAEVLEVPGTVTADSRALAAQGKSERLAIVSIYEWKSDTFINTALIYDLALRVYDVSGGELASNRITGNDNLGGDAINPPGHAKTAVPEAYLRKLEELSAPRRWSAPCANCTA